MSQITRFLGGFINFRKSSGVKDLTNIVPADDSCPEPRQI